MYICDILFVFSVQVNVNFVFGICNVIVLVVVKVELFLFRCIVLFGSGDMLVGLGVDVCVDMLVVKVMFGVVLMVLVL